MKTLIKFFNFFSIALLCRMLLISCTSEEPGVAPDPKDSVGTFSISADTISNHLQFNNATEIQGTIPTGSFGNDLKISFKDTLHLLDEVKFPVKFLHEDTTKNVSGVYVQVQAGFVGGTNATYYYDVPEIPDVADSDTVSVIMIGVDPAGLVDGDGVPPAGAPFIFDITITAYTPNGEPLVTVTRPVKIEKSDPQKSSQGACGLVNPPRQFWDWLFSYTKDKTNPNEYSFLSSPDRIFGAGGQFIKGCCINDNSSYNINCSGNIDAQRSLHFLTYYQIKSETFSFFDNGTYRRNTLEITANPAPDESNFCATGPGIGVVYESINDVDYFGNWSLTPIAVPSDVEIYNPDNSTRDDLSLQDTSSPGGGYGNPGGMLHFVTCDDLYMIQFNSEGSGQYLYKFYTRRTANPDGSYNYWYPIII